MKALSITTRTIYPMSFPSEFVWIDFLFILVGVAANTFFIAIVSYIISKHYKLRRGGRNQKRSTCAMYIISELVWMDILFITIGVVANTIVITLIVYFIAKLYKLKKIRMELVKRDYLEIANETFLKSSQAQSLIQDSPQFEKDQEAINSEKVQVHDRIGSGKYGDIYQGFLSLRNQTNQEGTPIPIIVKRASKLFNCMQRTLIWEELGVLRNVEPHPNIMCLVGVVLSNSKLPYTVFEYTEHPNLLEYLKMKRKSFDDPIELISFSYQIANGMKYLASIPLVHRDLSLRNISLTSEKIIRIGNFGISGIDLDQYYVREITEDAPFSAEMLSPEAYEDWDFTEKSDVWAFGVCLFEMFSLGEEPYQDVEDIQEFLKNGKRLAKPEYCNNEIYTLMLNCWNMDPVIRPNFSCCVEFFAQLLDSYDVKICQNIHEQLLTDLDYQRNLRKLAHDRD